MAVVCTSAFVGLQSSSKFTHHQNRNAILMVRYIVVKSPKGFGKSLNKIVEKVSLPLVGIPTAVINRSHLQTHIHFYHLSQCGQGMAERIILEIARFLQVSSIDQA